MEGTSSHGLGFARCLQNKGVEVIEVARPNRQVRRMRGKSDPTDALAAARAVLAGEATAPAKAHHGTITAVRALRISRRSTATDRTRVVNQLKPLVTTAPDTLRAELETLATRELIDKTSRFRPGADPTDPTTATKTDLCHLAHRRQALTQGSHQALTEEISGLDAQLAICVADAAPPRLLDMVGVGTEVASILLVTAGDNPHRLRTEASFAALCGVSPLDASSGRQRRHRLNRGGDRQANHAL